MDANPTSDDRAKKREDIIRKVRALKQLTVDRGSSESEAMEAAKKVAKMMAEYDIAFSEVGEQKTKEEAIHEDRTFDPVFEKPVRKLQNAISELCSVMVIGMGAASAKMRIYGTPLDVEVASYLLDLCVNAMRTQMEKKERDWAMFKRNHRLRERQSFLLGMADRMDERLKELAWARHKPTGAALVPVKDDLIRTKMKEDGFSYTYETRPKGLIFELAYTLGYVEGGKVPLNQAVGQDRPAARDAINGNS